MHIPLLSALIPESSPAAEEANRLGLDYLQFGRWGKNGQVTHTSVNGKLTPVDTAPQQSAAPIASPQPQDSDTNYANTVAKKHSALVRDVVKRIIPSVRKNKRPVDPNKIFAALQAGNPTPTDPKYDVDRQHPNTDSTKDFQLLSHTLADYINKRYNL